MTRKNDIVKSNAFIEASYSPGSVYRMRLIMACLLQVKAKEKLSHKRIFSVTANALADLTGSAAKNNYKELRKAAEDLTDWSIVVQHKPDGSRIRADRSRISVVGRSSYYDKEGRVELEFTPQILPYISQIKTQFTQYQAKYIMHMTSSYGIRLYELCLQWMGNEREFAIEDFKQLLGLEKKYKSIEALKRRVINPAIRDINTYSDIQASFGQRKSGRRVTHLQFKITRPEAEKSIPRVRRGGKITRAEVRNKSRTGESWEEAEERLKAEQANGAVPASSHIAAIRSKLTREK